MISLIAQLRPASGVGSAALRDVSAHLRGHQHLLCAPGQYLVTFSDHTALVEESRSLLRVDIAVDSEDAAARACASLAREVDAALGGFGVVINWSRREGAAQLRH